MTEIQRNPIVVDLLINLLSAAATCNNPRGWNRNGLGLANRAPAPGMGIFGYPAAQGGKEKP
jgi:hypothetical protein